MKKIVFLSFLTLCFASTSFAQGSVKKVNKKSESSAVSKQPVSSTGLASDTAVPVQTVANTVQSTQAKGTPVSESAAPYIPISPNATKHTGNSAMPSQSVTTEHKSVDNGK